MSRVGTRAPQTTGTTSPPAAPMASANTRSSAVKSADARSTAKNTGANTTAVYLPASRRCTPHTSRELRRRAVRGVGEAPLAPQPGWIETRSVEASGMPINTRSRTTSPTGRWSREDAGAGHRRDAFDHRRSRHPSGCSRRCRARRQRQAARRLVVGDDDGRVHRLARLGESTCTSCSTTLPSTAPRPDKTLSVDGRKRLAEPGDDVDAGGDDHDTEHVRHQCVQHHRSSYRPVAKRGV